MTTKLSPPPAAVAVVVKSHFDERDWQAIEPIDNALDRLPNGTRLYAEPVPVAELQAEIAALHLKLAGETLRADQGWERYEARNRYALRLEKELMEKSQALQKLVPVGTVAKAGVYWETVAGRLHSRQTLYADLSEGWA